MHVSSILSFTTREKSAHGFRLIDLVRLLFGAGPTGIMLAQLLKLNRALDLMIAAPRGRKFDLI
jgi:threonine dehydrogenase-like Zn-dependent dehydrogenase